jgi:hypothetical protein
MRPRLGPTIKWCGIELPRAYRAGNWGSVASVLIEKPARGNFLPIADGGRVPRDRGPGCLTVCAVSAFYLNHNEWFTD